MRRLDEALSDLVESRQADGPDYVIDALRRRLAGEPEPVAVPRRTGMDTAANRWPGPLIAATAVVAALLIAVPILWLRPGDDTTSAGQAPVTTTSLTPATTMLPTPTVVATTTAASSRLEKAPLQLGDEIAFSQSADTLWARDGEGNIAGYRDGVWQAIPALPAAASDVAGTLDGPVWAVASNDLWYLEDGAWRALPEARSVEPENVELDGDTGIVWMLSPAGLYMWDGMGVSLAGSLPNGVILDDFVVAGDRTIWAARNNFYLPWMDRLVRFDESTGTWVSVRPLGGTDDLPATVAVTPGGDVWVATRSPESAPVPSALELAYLDTAIDRWVTYRLPGGPASDIVADDEVVWFKQKDVARFDGEAMTVFSPGGTLDNLGLGNDGTVWVTIRYERNGLYRLVIDE